MPSRVYTAERDGWLRENYPSSTSRECAEAFNLRFGTACSARAISVRASVLGIRKERAPRSCETVPERAARRVRWGDEPGMQAWMEANWRLSNPERSAAFAREFGFPLSRPQITLWRQANGRTLAPSHGGGRQPRPVGSRYRTKGGYWMEKVRERPAVPGSKDNWELAHVAAYRRAFGEVPEGATVWIADGDPDNLDPANLVAVPRRVHGVLNNPSLGYAWSDAETLHACVAAASLAVAATDAEASMPRACEVCGAEFVPEGTAGDRHGGRKTCRACIEAGRRARGNRCGGETGVCERCGRAFAKNVRRQRICRDCRHASGAGAGTS